jgi:FtsH-binding integral membrane protein
MKKALIGALKPAIRTLAQTLAGSLGALAVAQVSDFRAIGSMAIVLVWGALIAFVVTYLQNFAEMLGDDTGE